MSALLLIVDPPQRRYVEPMLFYCCASVADDGSTLKRYWLNASYFLGHDQSGSIVSPLSAALAKIQTVLGRHLLLTGFCYLV